MKLKLSDLDPHLLKRVSPVAFEYTDDIHEAAGLALQCPACHWASRRTHSNNSHMLVIWEDPARWQFIGHGYKDLSLMAGRVMVSLTGASVVE